MLMICEGIFFIAGLIALIVGKFRLYGKQTIQGTRARVVGLILMAPGPLALSIGLVIGASGRVTQETINLVTGIEMLIVGAAFVGAAVVTLTTPEEPTMEQASSPMEDSAHQLRSLKEMLDAGLITAQEYEAKKTEILSRM
jgi:hypothetical protein